MYHRTLRPVIDRIDRYEIETGGSVSHEYTDITEFIYPTVMDNTVVSIIPDTSTYTAFIQGKITDGLAVTSLGFENTIIETSVGKTGNGEIVTLETHEYRNQVIKNLEDIATGLIIVLIAMIIIAIVPGSLLIESLARRSSMMKSLGPASATGSDDILYAGIVDSSGVAFLITSPEGIVVTASPSCLELLEVKKDAEGFSLASLTALPREMRTGKISQFWRADKKRIQIQLMNGSKRNCIMEVHPFYREEKVASILFLFLLELADHRLPADVPGSSDGTGENMSSQARIHLVKSVIHDMNNHISGIIGVASIGIDIAASDAVRDPFKAVLDSAEKLTNLCNDLQSTVTGGSDKQLRDISREMYLIAEVLKKILPGRVEVEVTGGCNAGIRANRELLREFFYGLALNSTAMMNGEGRIRINVSENIPMPGNAVEMISPGNKVCIRYSDGFIMPVALRDILSNRNYSVSDIERQFGATIGNGYKALTNLAGSIVFERGSGETILCLLLDGYELPSAENTPERRSPGNPEVDGLSVLVADEVEIVLDSISGYLEHSGMTTIRAKNGDQVMELLKSNSFDAAVLDLNMPGVPTSGIVRYCQTSKPDMAIVITSGFDTPHGVRDLLTASSTDYLHKPHRPEILVKMIYHLVSRLKDRE
ncbi:MAG: response regulator [Candidatus Sabulitectum sp.]|nr:response regulator [Candidatus Sabulitectum sp.]